MKVTTELIEKYNQGQCTASEIDAVEDWLLNDEDADEIEISKESETQLKAEIWDDISEVLPSRTRERVWKLSPHHFRWVAVAASVSILFVVSATSLFTFNKEKQNQVSLVTLRAEAPRIRQQKILTEDFDIVLGDRSSASFNSDTGLIDFCGAIKISPKKDISLSFSDVCSEDGSESKGVDFKKGQTYFAMNYKNQNSDQVVVMNENLIFELPPIIKNQLSDQFDI